MVYGVGQPFTYRLVATNTPFEYAIGNAEPLPPGILFDTLTGTFTGAGTAAGIYNFTVLARNSDGWSSPTSITMGIFEPTINEVFREVTVDVTTWSVVSNDPEAAIAAVQNTTETGLPAAIFTVRYGDDLFLKVNFAKGTALPQTNIPLVMAKFAIRGNSGDPPLLQTDELAFRKTTEWNAAGTEIYTSAFIYLSLADAPLLQSWLEDREQDVTTQNNVSCEIEFELETPLRAAGPQTQVLTTRPFVVRVIKDTIP